MKMGRTQIMKECQWCGELKIAARNKKQKYCSKACRDEANRNSESKRLATRGKIDRLWINEQRKVLEIRADGALGSGFDQSIVVGGPTGHACLLKQNVTKKDPVNRLPVYSKAVKGDAQTCKFVNGVRSRLRRNPETKVLYRDSKGRLLTYKQLSGRQKQAVEQKCPMVGIFVCGESRERQ
jgi:hypothetical protein